MATLGGVPQSFSSADFKLFQLFVPLQFGPQRIGSQSSPHNALNFNSCKVLYSSSPADESAQSYDTIYAPTRPSKLKGMLTFPSKRTGS
jgi:hypothetical protein